MGLFDPPAVKELKKKSQFIGGLYGNVHLGHFSHADLDELVHAESQRAELQAAFAAASAEVGPEKAMKLLCGAPTSARTLTPDSARPNTAMWCRRPRMDAREMLEA